MCYITEEEYYASCQLSLDLKAPPQGYTVWINGQKFQVPTKKEAWRVISNRGWGAIYAVYDKHGEICEEFVPF